MSKPATDKQYALLTRLATEKSIMGVERTELLDQIERRVMNASGASTWIDWLFRQPRKQSAAATVEPGYYLSEGDVFVVVTARNGSGNTYAKRLDMSGSRARWEYAPGAVRQLGGQTPMTLEDAKQWGHAHGFCIACGAALTDPKSVEAGIGPVCAKKFGGAA